MDSLRCMVLAGAICLHVPACEDSGKSTVNGPLLSPTSASLHYKAYTSSGALAVVGTMTLAKTDTVSVQGSWVLEGVAGVNGVGPQVGTGTLRGRVEGSTISLNLNPGWVDNNVILAGTIESEKISGTWTWVTFSGPTSSGRFEATKSK
jgi:hypothetical protein